MEKHTTTPSVPLGADDEHRYLRGIEFPISKEKVLHGAREHGASTDMIEKITHLPQEQFDTPAELIEALHLQDDLQHAEDLLKPLTRFEVEGSE